MKEFVLKEAKEKIEEALGKILKDVTLIKNGLIVDYLPSLYDHLNSVLEEYSNSDAIKSTLELCIRDSMKDFIVKNI